MKKRILFYLFQIIAIAILLYLSVLSYFKDTQKTYQFILERKENFILIYITILIFTSFFEIMNYNKTSLNKEYDIIKEVFKILGKTLIIIFIVSFIEYFVFYKTKVGRLIYVGLYFFISIFFIIEYLLINYIKSKQKQKLLWASVIPSKEVENYYNIGIDENGVNNNIRNSNGYDIAIYDYPPKNGTNVSQLLSTIITIKKPIDLISYIEEYAECIPLRYVDELWLLKNIRTYENAYDKIRRIVNIMISFVLLVLLFPISFLIALVHRVTSKGPIFFIQERVGYKGRTFKLIKFRTMIHNAEKDGPQFAKKDDPRITKIGRFMRLFRIDEVPQLINILKGEMNLIGPRPERKEFISMLEKKIPYYRLRLEVRPGLTGWAQVNYYYAGEDIEEHFKKLEYDLYYIKNRGLPLDILILFKTIRTVLMRKGT